MSIAREKFATQVDSALLDSVRKLAKSEGRQIQAVVEDALAGSFRCQKWSPRPRACDGRVSKKY